MRKRTLKGDEEHAKLAIQRGEMIKLDDEFLTLSNKIRQNFNIPEEAGFKENPAAINKWRKTVLEQPGRRDEWDAAIKELRVFLKKPTGWNELLERYLLTDFLCAPIYSFIVHEKIDIFNMIEEISFVQVDEPPRREHIERLFWYLEVPGGYKRKSVQKPRLYDEKEFELNKRIVELVKVFGRDYKKIANLINVELGVDYQDFEISDKYNKFLKRIRRERLF